MFSLLITTSLSFYNLGNGVRNYWVDSLRVWFYILRAQYSVNCDTKFGVLLWRGWIHDLLCIYLSRINYPFQQTNKQIQRNWEWILRINNLNTSVCVYKCFIPRQKGFKVYFLTLSMLKKRFYVYSLYWSFYTKISKCFLIQGVQKQAEIWKWL